MRARTAIALAAVLVGGCSAVTNFGEFEFQDREDLTLTLENLRAHETELMRILVTRREDVAIVFAGTLFSVGAGAEGPDDRDSLVLVFPGILENDVDYDVLLHVDIDQGSTIEMSEPLYGATIADDGTAMIRAGTPGGFDAPTINTLGNGFVDLTLTNFTPHLTVATQYFALTVVDAEDRKPVAYARVPDVPELNFGVFLSFVVTEGRPYLLEFYVDNDSNGVFSGPGNTLDHSWFEMRTATVDGIALVFDHRTPFQPLEFVR